MGRGDKIEANGRVATDDDVSLERKAWAEEFVDACRDKGLEAIGLTDHHEMVMIPYVQEAIAAKKAAQPDFDLWLLPGMELTASGGKQCLILFDSDLSVDWWRQAQGKLGISFAEIEHAVAKGKRVSQLKTSYSDLGAALDEIDGLKGRYIILPNVSEGGRYSVLLDGEHTDFSRMPYVGGYLDKGQTIKTLPSKYRQRLAGAENSVWSKRSIYPLPTSDCRERSYGSLASNNTWIKLAAPTAEAVRQAFLGSKSRISIEVPKLPTLYVAGIDVRNSSILQDRDVGLSPELNAVIGGRGSGKSSFLEYIAFGLGRSCFDAPRSQYSGSERLVELIKDTIIGKNGKISIRIIQDSAVFKIDRGPATAYQPQLTFPNGEQQTVTVRELRALFPAVVYSQGELAEIGKQAGKKAQLSDLLLFVDPEYKREDEQLLRQIETAKSDLNHAIQNLTDAWSDQSRLHKVRATKASLVQRAEALEKTLPELSDDDKEVVTMFDKSNDFESKRLQASKHADQIAARLLALKGETLAKRNLQNDLGEPSAGFLDAYNNLYDVYASQLEELIKSFEVNRLSLSGAEGIWADKFKALRAKRDEVLKKLGAHQTVTSQIVKLREELAQATNDIGDLEAKIKGRGDPAQGLSLSLQALRSATERRAARTKEWATEIGTLSNGRIHADVDAVGDKSELFEALDVLAAKTGSQEATRARMLTEALSVDDVWTVSERLRADALSLLYWCRTGATTGEERPAASSLFATLGDTDRLRMAVGEKLDAGRVQALACAVPRPQINLTYKDGTREIAFEKASEGQRAAALLFMLLDQQGGPLIVDQPEGDLDNKIISDLTDKLHVAKSKRQLVLASHNANIVVNGSSELVGHLEVSDDGRRRFACIGAIDTPTICEVITSTMEGGVKAFRDRQDKYGF